MTEPIRPWTEYASEEWDRMTRADPTPLEPWSWTCPTCGAEMPRDAIDRLAALKRWLASIRDPHRWHIDDPLYGYAATEDICDQCWNEEHPR